MAGSKCTSFCCRQLSWAGVFAAVLLALLGRGNAFCVRPTATRRAVLAAPVSGAPAYTPLARATQLHGCACEQRHVGALARPALPRQRDVRMAMTGVGLGAGRRVLATAVASTAAVASMGGGVLAGGLHAISGPDHLAALLPRIMGKAWPVAMRIGAVWGLGHGFSATLIGLAAFFLKDRIRAGGGGGGRWISQLGTYTEALVGISLITIGLIGLKESLLDKPHDHGDELPPEEPETDGSETAGSVTAAKKKKRGSHKAIFLNGLLHGFSWDGAPSLAPALACTTWHGVLWFLLAYCGGTMAAMSAATTIIGEGSVRVGQALEQPDIPKRLSVISSGIAIAIGALWLAKAVFFGQA